MSPVRIRTLAWAYILCALIVYVICIVCWVFLLWPLLVATVCLLVGLNWIRMYCNELFRDRKLAAQRA